MHIYIWFHKWWACYIFISPNQKLVTVKRLPFWIIICNDRVNIFGFSGTHTRLFYIHDFTKPFSGQLISNHIRVWWPSLKYRSRRALSCWQSQAIKYNTMHNIYWSKSLPWSVNVAEVIPFGIPLKKYTSSTLKHSPWKLITDILL